MFKRLFTALAILLLPQITESAPRNHLQQNEPRDEKIKNLRRVKIYNLSGQEYISLVLYKKNKKNTTNKDIINIVYK